MQTAIGAVSGRSLSARVAVVGVVFALIIGSLVFAALRVAGTIREMQHESNVLAIAMRTHVEMDMMHYAMQAAVLTSIEAGLTGDTQLAIRARNDFAEYSAWTNRLRDKMRSLEVPDETRTDFVTTSSAYADYLQLASAVVEVGTRDPEEAIRRKVPFDAKFVEIGEANQAISDRLEARVGRATETLEAELDWIIMMIALGAVFLLMIIGGLVFLVRRGIVYPLVRITDELVTSDPSGLPRESQRTDEIGALARSVTDFRDAADRIRRSEAARDEAERDAAEQVERKRALAANAEALEQRTLRIVQQVTETASQLKDVADSLAASAGRSQIETTSAAAAAEQTLGGVLAIAQATDELLVSIEEVASRIHVVAQSSDEARALATSTETTITELNEMAKRITSFTVLIGEIAQRSNLLALNATIEAAHAGQAGSGFAVVADEVKQLSQQTAKAVEEIEAQIRGMSAITRNATKSLADMAKAITDLGGATTSIASAAEQQSLATSEIGRTIQMSSTGTEAMRGNLKRVEGQVGETARSAEAVREATLALDAQANELSQEMAAFIAQAKVA